MPDTTEPAVSSTDITEARIRAATREFHRSILDIVSVINRPENDEALLAQAGLTLERALFPLLVFVERLGPIGVVDLAGRAGRDYTTVSRQVSRLEELGLVQRQASSTDRRVREAVITQRGQAAVEAIDAAREQLSVAVFSSWSGHDFAEMQRLLRQLADGMMAVTARER